MVQRADRLIGCTDASADQGELEAIGEAIEAYEAMRWPGGKVDGGKGEDLVACTAGKRSPST